ncbi:MAG: hybrid sensor histidine kinase/response regulator [Chloroflexi bacterium]|nr:hybrid sensor histidine kinase/response regulator [Chloroflexota bacterium]
MTDAAQVLGDILVVDDTPANLRLLAQILSARGYKVRPVPGGLLALDAARAAPPDLILLDVGMPDLNGYEVCQRLKADEVTRDVPVLFISALDDIDSKVKAFTAGGVDYITKPFQVEEVAARVATHLALRNLQKQMQAVNDSLAVRNAELDAFAHTVAHDLKNALNTIMGYAEMLDIDLDELPAETIRVSTRAISRMSHKMNNIIEELMLLAGVRNKTVIAQPLDMGAIVDEALQRLEYLIRESHAKVRVPSNWPIALGHGPWVEEVWVNYVSNAIKYGGTSGYAPRVELGAAPLADGVVRFWVRDNGRGLSADEQSRLFTQFERLDQARATGHGLGLSIVKRIVERLGGQVAVSGQIGVGSEFSFTLPAQD